MAYTAKSPPAATGGAPNALSCRLAEGNSDNNPTVSLPQELPSRARDQRLMSLDFLGEVGDSFVTLGAALAAAASAENLPLVELVLRQMRAALLEAIAEFRELSPEGSPE